MSSPDPESHPGETSPLLGSTRSQHEDAPEETTTAPVREQQETPEDNDRLALWYLAALFTGIIAFVFLATEWYMAAYGFERFRYREWALDRFQAEIFGTLLVSITFTIANLVRIKTTRRAFPHPFNALVLAGLTFALAIAVGNVVSDQTWSKYPHCNVYDQPRDPDNEPSKSFEDCLKWAPKMQVIVLLLTFFVAIHTAIIGRLLVGVLEQLFGRTSRYFAGDSGQGRKQIYLQLSLGWGAPQQQNAIENQPRQESTPAQ
ncbi:hypothetical protein B0T10DRAFT_159904 [Thelonectria olida]|uniref:Uncharacterized protein n=1 Tax=Thelonectria olida TaxID=1576542 RepID=A0A9P8WDX0_9HYPO|nr:hypothetical protein B0T10DRAFT_159904 [Thelonectria olida]